MTYKEIAEALYYDDECVEKLRLFITFYNEVSELTDEQVEDYYQFLKHQQAKHTGFTLEDFINMFKAYRQTRAVDFLLGLNEYIDREMLGDDYICRICSECGKRMDEGYCVDNGLEYYCSDECLRKHYTQEQWEMMYDNGDGDSYWTTWYD